MVELGGIEPPTQRCERCVIPLYYSPLLVYRRSYFVITIKTKSNRALSSDRTLNRPHLSVTYYYCYFCSGQHDFVNTELLQINIVYRLEAN